MRHAAPVLALENTWATTAKITAKKVEVVADNDGDNGGSAIANVYEPSESLVIVMGNGFSGCKSKHTR